MPTRRCSGGDRSAPSLRVNGLRLPVAFSALIAAVCCAARLPGENGAPAAPEGPTAPAAYHVAPDGSDNNPGTGEKPFATLERARRAVRQETAAGLRRDVIVYIRGGTYYLAKPLDFSGGDGGDDRFSVTYAARPGEKVVVSGGRRIRGWRRGEGGLWTAQLDEVKDGKWWFRQLFADDQRQPRSRFPNEGSLLTVQEISPDLKTISFKEPLPDGSAWADAELVVYQNFSVSRARIKSGGGKQVVTATPAGCAGPEPEIQARAGMAAHLEHARAFVDRPGEWHLDRATGVLSYMAAEGEDPNDRTFVAPAWERVLAVEGSEKAPVVNLHFEGLTFAHAEFDLPDAGYAGIQAGHYGQRDAKGNLPLHVEPVAVELTHAKGCRFERCRFTHCGGSGVGLGPGCRSDALVDCRLDDIGGNGVMVGWRGKGEVGEASQGRFDGDWKDPADAPSGNEVRNCVVERCGRVNYGGVGVFVAFSEATEILHNEVRELPYTGISVGFRWNTDATTQRECVVEANHVHHVMAVLADGGGIYTLGAQPGTVLRGNYIHDVARSKFAAGGAPNNGIFFDEGSKGLLVEKNVIHDTSGEPIRFNQTSKDAHTFRDNSFGPKPGEPEFPKEIVSEAGPK